MMNSSKKYLSTADEAVKACSELCSSPKNCTCGGVIRFYPEQANSIGYVFCGKYDTYKNKIKIENNIKKTIPEPLLEKSIENYNLQEGDKKAVQLCKKYLEEKLYTKGQGFALLGSYGTGKTHLAVSVAKRLVENCASCLFLRSVELVQGSFEEVNRKLESVKDYKVVILDDFTEEKNSYFAKNAYKLFNAIYENNISLILTSNLSTKDLATSLGGRIFDRLAERNIFYELEQKASYRRKIRTAWSA